MKMWWFSEVFWVDWRGLVVQIGLFRTFSAASRSAAAVSAAAFFAASANALLAAT